MVTSRNTLRHANTAECTPPPLATPRWDARALRAPAF